MGGSKECVGEREDKGGVQGYEAYEAGKEEKLRFLLLCRKTFFYIFEVHGKNKNR